jgi:glycine/D-amino acid oxidase-like deaminating enzyme
VNIPTPAVGLTEHHDLRTGNPPWDEKAWLPPQSGALPGARVDVVIIGSGVMGSILAERLSAEGHSLAVLDRRPPGCGSTAASTAEIMWAMDVPLSTLAERIGEAEAARRWTRVYAAVRALGERIDALGIDAARVDRPTVYLAGGLLDEAGLQREQAMLASHGLPSAYLDAGEIAARFGIAPRAGLVADGGFEVDPVRLSHAMLALAVGRGAHLRYPCDVVAISEAEGGVRLDLADGAALSAGAVILAGGYERAGLFLPPAFSLLSSYVIATAPGVAPLWRENAMIWEASDPYLYVRTTADGRIVAGGEDEELVAEDRRDAMLAGKAGAIAAGLEAMLGSGPIAVDRRWCATFGNSPDGLPAIGRAANMRNIWLSAGFGGNGIAFAGLAADILSAALAGREDADAACFDPYRFS